MKPRLLALLAATGVCVFATTAAEKDEAPKPTAIASPANAPVYRGIVSQLDSEAKTFSFKTRSGAVRVVKVDGESSVSKGDAKADFSAITVGCMVSGRAVSLKGLNYRAVTVKVEPAPPDYGKNDPPSKSNPADAHSRKPGNYRGTVVRVDAADKSFIFKTSKGDEHIVKITDETKLEKNGTAADFNALAVGTVTSGLYFRIKDNRFNAVTVKIQDGSATNADEE